MEKEKVMGKRISWLTVLWVVSTVSGANAAPPTEHFLICIPGGPGTAEEADARLGTFLDSLGEGVVSLKGHYAVTKEACEAILLQHKPRFALFSHAELRERAQALKPVPLLTVTPVDEQPIQYFIVAQKGVTFDSLKGKSLLSPHWPEESLLSQVAFKRDLKAHFSGKKGSALRALKKVAKGKADAALLDALEHASMKELPFANNLDVVLTSIELPGLAIVELGGLTALGKKLRTAGARLCSSSSDACKAVEMKELKPSEPKEYDILLK